MIPDALLSKLAGVVVTVLVLLGAWSGSVLTKTSLGGPCTSGTALCREQFPLREGGSLSVFRNFPLSGSQSVTAVVVVVHGTGRNAGAYFTRMVKAAQLAGVDSTTLVAAPWFTTSSDKAPKGALTWTSGGWKAGDDSTSGVSSFTAMDELLARFADRSKFPNVTRITVAGHSAGGQFTHRYAASGASVDTPVSYVVANPSSYLYPVPERPSGGSFVKPSGGCSDYDQYKYGLSGRPPYLAKLSAQEITHNLATRRITYLLGASDTEKDSDLDTNCGAMLEGKNRFERGTFFYTWIHSTFPDSPSVKVVVPGTAHDGAGMFQSSQARPVLFGK